MSEEKRASCRIAAVKELVTTERTYVDLLSKLIKFYVEALASTNIISPEEQAILFPSDIYTIRNCNQSFLNALEKLTIEFDNSNTKIGEEILHFSPYFKMYQNYCNNFEKATMRLKKLQDNYAFVDFAQKARKNFDNATLESLLILPIQRIPRYRILLEEIIKNTESSHPDLQHLQKALEKIKEVNKTIDERMLENTRREQVKNIEEKFGGSITLLEPARRFVMEGILCKVERRDDRDYVFFLFTDCLVYGSHAAFVGSLKFQNLLPINAAFDVKNMNGSAGHMFAIYSSVESFYVYTANEEEKNTWMQAMLKLKEDNKERGLRVNEDLTVAPLFIPDDHASSCMLQCQTKFTFVERRHHCYYCGLLVCGKCSAHRLPERTTAGGTTINLVRVCDVCYEKHISKFPELKTPNNTQTRHVDENIIESPTALDPVDLELNSLYDAFITKANAASNGVKSAATIPSKNVRPSRSSTLPSSRKSFISNMEPAKLQKSTSEILSTNELENIGIEKENQAFTLDQCKFIKEFLQENIGPILSQLTNRNTELSIKNEQLTMELEELRKKNEKLCAKIENVTQSPICNDVETLRIENAQLQKKLQMLQDDMKHIMPHQNDQINKNIERQDELVEDGNVLRSKPQKVTTKQGHISLRSENFSLQRTTSQESIEEIQTKGDFTSTKNNITTIGQKSAHCVKCQKVLEGRGFKASNGDRHHHTCFVCDACKETLIGKKFGVLKKDDGTMTYFCANCTQRHNEEEIKKIEEEEMKQSTKNGSNSSSSDNQTCGICSRCSHSIIGRGVLTSSELYHLHCFICDDCKTPLAKKIYGLLRNGDIKQRLCSNCMERRGNTRSKKL